MANSTDTYDQSYFSSGGYSELRHGMRDKYFWSRRFYASLVRRYCADGRVLDMGCGLGHVLARLQDSHETYGIDVSPYAIEAAAKVAPRADLRVLPAEGLHEFGAGYFDAIVSIHVVEHLADPMVVLKQAHDVLAPDGVLILATPNLGAPLRRSKGQRWFGYQDPEHISLNDGDGWTEMLTEAGFRVQRRFGDGMWDVPYLPLIPAKLQLAFFGLPAVVQTLTGLPFIPTALSESVILIARRVETPAARTKQRRVA